MSAPGPRPDPSGVSPAKAPSIPWWDSAVTLIALIAVTIVAVVVSVRVDHKWRTRMAAREAESQRALHGRTVPPVSRPAPTVMTEVGPPVSLTDLRPTATPDPPAGGLGHDALPDGGPIVVLGGGTRAGIVMAPGASGVASVEYAIDGRYDRFVAQPAMCGLHHVPGAGPLTFRAIVDGQTRWSSPPLHLGQLDHVAVPISGGQVLRLEVRCVGDTRPSGPGAWLDARLIPTAIPVGR